MCMRARAEARHACAAHTHPLRAIPRASTWGKHHPRPVSAFFNPPRQSPPFNPTFTQQIPSTTRIPPCEPLNQYSPFYAGQEYHPSCPPPWTNFRHRPRRLSLRDEKFDSSYSPLCFTNIAR